MVRTYGYNAASSSADIELFKQNASRRNFQESENLSKRSLDTFSSSYSDSRILNNESPAVIQSQPAIQNVQNNNHMASNFPPLNQSNAYQSSLHSSMIDPIGSIVGLRLIYVDGQLVYVPVEPHINFLINRHFGSATNLGMQANQPSEMLTNFPSNHLQQPQIQNMPQLRASDDMQLIQQKQNNGDWNNFPEAQRKTEVPNQAINKHYGSLPNLAQKPILSSQEQHKLDLKMQVEENLKRKQLEKQKELELEQREIRRWEEYQARLKEEEEREKRLSREKAMAMERRSQEVYEQQKMESKNIRTAWRQAHNQPRQPAQYDYGTEDEEPIRPAVQNNRRRESKERFSSNTDSYSSDEFVHKTVSKPRMRTEEPRPDSAQPREIEWWEKKPTWQEKQPDRKSAVIPTLRGKPPPVPDSQRSGYDPAASVSEHQSRPTSHATSRTTTPAIRSSQEESDNSEVSYSRHSSARPQIKKPTAFTISG